MKFASTLFAAACLLPAATSFVPVASASSRSSTSLAATVEKAKLVPPKKVQDLATGTEDLYKKSVQETYGYVYYVIIVG
jgi:hypothetical protein